MSRAERDSPPTATEADAFIAQTNVDLKELWTNAARAEWVKSTYITDDTEILAAQANEKVMAYMSRANREAVRFDGVETSVDTRRQLQLLKLAQSLPAPADPAKRKRLAEIAAKLEGLYGKGKFCKQTPKGESCRDLESLSAVLSKSHDYDELLEAWQGWRTISPPMRPLFKEYVALANEGAQEIGFKNLGEMWMSGYDMSPAEFAETTSKLWTQVSPLYEALHCNVRAKLARTYGAERVPPQGPIPAHLLGNMWAQEWAYIYPLVRPYKVAGDIDVTRALKKKRKSELDLVRLGEKFFTSLGLDPLPDTFWTRSMFVKPTDRDVVCHASAWDVTYGNDLRIKMCIKVDQEDLITIHHELGHNYYFMYYHDKPVLYQNGANDGFHEAIGDMLALSVTPGYLKSVGILDSVPRDTPEALINRQYKDALEKVAFLPFGKLIDEWRWKVFSGEISPENYNQAWWNLREKYQGVAPPVERSESDFDPGAKYHVPANVPYTRYFLARILQFQFHRALCRIAGHEGPLHTCSIYGNQEVGKKLEAMLAMGSSKPWPDALEALTGERAMDASAMIEYFEPLMKWLGEQNKGLSCGW
ncbi:MAG: M2 family metallopeptidase [Deltaproteobacteria bacterium]|nr:M2 family metallopeptidase [Deltaproteobacteria bacterium]